MIELIKHVLIAIGGSFLLTQLQLITGSTYIIDFLKQNLITIILALLAINTTTTGIVLTKIRELIDKEGKDSFRRTKRQMLISIKEQIVLVILAISFFVIETSDWLKSNPNIHQLIDVSCISIFIYDLLILYDTARSVFIIIEYNNESK